MTQCETHCGYPERPISSIDMILTHSQWLQYNPEAISEKKSSLSSEKGSYNILITTSDLANYTDPSNEIQNSNYMNVSPVDI